MCELRTDGAGLQGQHYARNQLIGQGCGRKEKRTASGSATPTRFAASPSATRRYGTRHMYAACCFSSGAVTPCGIAALPLLRCKEPRLRSQACLPGLAVGVRAGACSDPSKSRGIDNTASPVEAAAVDQRRNACPVGERTVASMRHDGQDPQPRPRPGRLVLKTRPDSVAVTGRCSCFAAGEQQYLLLAGAGTAVLPLRRAKTGALRAPSRSCASRPEREPQKR